MLLLAGCGYVTDELADRVCPPPAAVKVICPPLPEIANGQSKTDYIITIIDQYRICAKGQA
jgi:hypothetical protein